jgi:hypothetical protein
LQDLKSVLLLLAVAMGLSSCGQSAPNILVQPKSRSVVIGETATFSVAATGGSPVSCQWQKGGTPIPGATSAAYTTPPATAADNGSQFSAVITNSGGSTTSSVATLSVSPTTDVLTYHNDNARTGQNLTESILNLSNVNSGQFGKLGFFRTNEFVDAEPLYASNVAVPNQGTHNLLIVATEGDSVYAFDPDSGAPIWQMSVLKTGETPSDDPSAQSHSEIGVNATPVIDRSQGPNGAVYLVASSKDASGNYYLRLHALDLALGTELFGGPLEVQASYPGTGDNSDGTNVIFDPKQYRERSGLLLLNGVIYTTWASHYDLRPYTGWVIGYNESTLAETSVMNITPNGNGGAIWMSAAAPAADNSGNIYFLAANGDFDNALDANGFPSQGDYGNAFMKLSTTGNQLAVADYFEADNDGVENLEDIDLGSGGAMLLPDLSDGSGHTLHLAVGAGKDTNIYLVNRDSMGKSTEADANIYQELDAVLPGGIWSAPAYFNNTIYYGPVGGPMAAFPITNGKLPAAPAQQTTNDFAYPGTTPSVSANGTNNGIIWALEAVPGKWPNAPTSSPLPLGLGVLHAYNAANLQEIYNSNQASNGRDQTPANKFVTPLIVNGKVFVGTPIGVTEYGLLP